MRFQKKIRGEPGVQTDAPAKRLEITTKKKGWFRRHIAGVILAIILIAGASLLAYPSVSNYWNQFHQTRAVMSYVDTVENLDEAEYERVLNAAYSYNQNLSEHGFNWQMTGEEQADYEQQLSIESSGIMGYVNIPKINVMLPIYHGMDESVLQIAIGHLEATSLPVGCESYSHEKREVTDKTEGSHCVISGHRGLPSARLFTDLDQMVEGDQFSLTVLNETLTYEVDQIRIVEPTDLSDLQLVRGEDYCTLVTCTPYGINTHRLLVRGHRVENVFDDANIKPEAIRYEPGLIAPLVAAPILLVLLIMLLIVTRKRKPTEAFPAEAEQQPERGASPKGKRRSEQTSTTAAGRRSKLAGRRIKEISEITDFDLDDSAAAEEEIDTEIPKNKAEDQNT